jgi:hypothetical protein
MNWPYAVPPYPASIALGMIVFFLILELAFRR